MKLNFNVSSPKDSQNRQDSEPLRSLSSWASAGCLQWSGGRLKSLNYRSRGKPGFNNHLMKYGGLRRFKKQQDKKDDEVW